MIVYQKADPLEVPIWNGFSFDFYGLYEASMRILYSKLANRKLLKAI